MANCRQYAVDSMRTRGFSFVEIMFAVVILGIGFIMVASIFPVALQQSKSTTDEISAAAISRGAAAAVSQVFSDSILLGSVGTTNLAATGVTSAINGTTLYYTRPFVAQVPLSTFPVTGPPNPPGFLSAWDSLCGKLIASENPRYAYVMVYRRIGMADIAPPKLDTWAPYTQIYVFPVEARNKDIFTSDDITLSPLPPYTATEPTANLMAHKVQVIIEVDETGTSLAYFDNTSGGVLAFNIDAAAEGGYIIISDDKIKQPTGAITPLTDNRGRMNGNIYRLGARRADLDTITRVAYELAPGNEFIIDPGADGILGDLDDPSDVNRKDNITAIGELCPLPSTVDVTGPADAFIIGRGYLNPLDPSKGFDGTAMPISAFSTFVKVK